MKEKFFYHQEMRALSVIGEDAGQFLNDLLTAQIHKLDRHTARMACLLSPQGRILFDMMVIRNSEEHFFCITEEQQIKPLLQRLTLYRLRRPIVLEISEGWMIGHRLAQADEHSHPAEIRRIDERHPALGQLCLLPEQDTKPAYISEDSEWDTIRISHGIPQTARDLIPNRALMLEAGLEHLHAVDFKKGCYIGQEVTARTHYRGLVKRRILPVTCLDHQLFSQQSVFWQEKEIGQILSISNDHHTALASLRLDAVRAMLNGDYLTNEKGHKLTVSIPEWMHPLPGFDEE